MTDTVPISVDTRKRLGQFFTGEPLARLLAALADAHRADSVIDPMGGSGDMIAAALSLTPNAAAAAIEIEPGAARTATERLGTRVSVVRGSAFDASSWSALRPAWDLVITNPPYVRYQVGSTDGDDEFDIPSAERVRAGLVELIGLNTYLNDVEREAFLHCARSYSGLADLAVPSWLLCASKVAIGGRLAVLVPSTWISRDYAAPVLYVLRRFFNIEYVVDDKDMAWFSDALVRTTLVVARRTVDKGTAFAPGAHLRISLPSSLTDERSVVGAAFPNSKCPERDFAGAAGQALARGSDGVIAGAAARLSDESDLIKTLRAARIREPWPCIVHVEHNGNPLPERIRQAVPVVRHELVTIEGLGWKIGQGLRSGANDFFYVTKVGDGQFTSPMLPGEVLVLPDDAVLPAVRRQADVSSTDNRSISFPASSYVLVLNGWALPEDIDAAEGPTPWKRMTGDLARLTRAAATHAYNRGKSTVLLPQLSAVRTNVRAGSDARRTPARFWYHLPPLAPRHRPLLYVARVNGGHPLTSVNHGGRVVDANFSTLWPADSNALPTAAMLALLRSIWGVAFMEVTGTILGGGALKVEASHLRRLMFPSPSEKDVESFQKFGELIMTGQLDGRAALDDLVVGLLGVADTRATAIRLRALAAEHHTARTTKAKRR